MAIPNDSVRQALQAAREDLLRKPNVVATGIGYKVADGERTDEMSIVCSVTQKLPESQLAAVDLVPPSVAGVPTDVVATGSFRALDVNTQRMRPAPGGCSIGHRDITAGTLGCLVRKGGETYILSNNHVLANVNAGQAGDPILQPGVYDGGKDPDDRVAVLSEFVPIALSERASTCGTANGIARSLNWLARLVGSDARLAAVSTAVASNRVDAALAKPLSDDLVSPEILRIGTPQATAGIGLGDKVRKSGRTTGYTEDEVLQVDVTVDVGYDGVSARFVDQVMAGPMSQGGDSGSAVVDAQGRLVGLLFAGSDTNTLLNPIDLVFSALGVEL